MSIEDRVLAPLPVSDVHLEVSWPALLTVAPPGRPDRRGARAGARHPGPAPPGAAHVLRIVIPITFLGATYYPWASLTPIPWLKVGVLVNPLVYMSEGFRMALTPVAHMPGPAVYAALVGFVLGLGWLGVTGFRRRVLA